MGKCKKGVYRNNKIILNTPFACFGGRGIEPCPYLKECATQQIKPRITKERWKKLKDKFLKKKV